MSTTNSLLDQLFTRIGSIETAGQLRVDLLLPLLAVVLVLYLSLRQVYTSSEPNLFRIVSNAISKKSTFPLPPGPPSWPIFGYLPGLPRISRAWEVYNKWGEIYGDIIYVPSFRRHIIILNSAEAVFELLEQRGNIYSDRPRLVMLQELMDLGQTTAFARYGTDWRHHRKIYNQQMNINAVKKFRTYQFAAARDLLALLLESPEAFAKHCRHFSAGIALNIAYGYQIARENDKLVHLTELTGLAFGQASQPGFYMVDNFPILRYIPSFFPFTKFKAVADQTRKVSFLARTVPFRHVVQGMKAGNFRKCFVSESLGDLENFDINEAGETKQLEEKGFSYEDLKNDQSMGDFEKREDVSLIKAIAGGIFGAGTTTTTSAIQSFIIAMILYPSVQQKAHEELDRVLGFLDNANGGGRLPTFEDQPSLPYINAICREVLRWFPVTPTAVPHVTTEEDVYKGYRIPKGSILIPNAWNILHDPQTYPDPDEFKPERFLPDEKGNILARDPAVSGAFGFGRRICAGRNLAEASIWIAVASILAVFNISPALDADGKPIDVKPALHGTPGLFNHPLPFKCRLEPRTERAKKIVLESYAAA